jgi:FkbM family methyltransferase
VLEFEYPSQTPTMLVLFGDLIDPEFAFLRLAARRDWVVFDVGAAIGQFSLFAAGLPAAAIHAFEPSGANVAVLTRNVARNGATPRVAIHQMALSDEIGEAVFETAAATWMSQIGQPGSAGGEVVPVSTVPEEMRRHGIDRLSVLKVNVAGYEPTVLKGAEPILAEGRADILILLLGLASLPWYERLAGHGYRFFYFHPAERVLYEVTRFDESSVLDHRPWPARHLIGIHASAIEEGRVPPFEVRKL